MLIIKGYELLEWCNLSEREEEEAEKKVLPNCFWLKHFHVKFNDNLCQRNKQNEIHINSYKCYLFENFMVGMYVSYCFFFLFIVSYAMALHISYLSILLAFFFSTVFACRIVTHEVTEKCEWKRKKA